MDAKIVTKITLNLKSEPFDTSPRRTRSKPGKTCKKLIWNALGGQPPVPDPRGPPKLARRDPANLVPGVPDPVYPNIGEGPTKSPGNGVYPPYVRREVDPSVAANNPVNGVDNRCSVVKVVPCKAPNPPKSNSLASNSELENPPGNNVK